ncbi:hypothetical protein C8J57DRAFT_1218628 [Mycena rebaudengoi]|nr:hypothetical protein C8J57DRAFT_1218628 [Mycena rebaudengoi]
MENTPFWSELITGNIHVLEKHSRKYATTNKDPQLAGSTGGEDIDDCGISSRAVKQATMQFVRESLTSENQIAEGLDSDPAEMVAEENVLEPHDNARKRRRNPTTRYQGFWQHRDDEDEWDLNFYLNCVFSGAIASESNFTLLGCSDTFLRYFGEPWDQLEHWVRTEGEGLLFLFLALLIAQPWLNPTSKGWRFERASTTVML